MLAIEQILNHSNDHKKGGISNDEWWDFHFN